MPVFRFDITAMIPVTSTVEVEAESIEEAHAIVRKPSWYRERSNVRFTLGGLDNPIDDLILPALSDHERR